MAKQTNENEIFENPEVLAQQFNKTEEFVKSNKSIFISAIAGIFLIAIAVVGYRWFDNKKEKEAQEAIFKAEYFFGLDSLDLALNGTDDFNGFVQVAEEYSGTSAGNLAKLYAGSIYLKQGETDQATDILSGYDDDAFIVSAKAYALTGDAFLEAGNTEEALKFYRKASESLPTKEFTPSYLVKLGMTQEMANDLAGAVLTYEKFVKEYPRDRKIDDVKKQLAKVKILATKKD